MKPGGRHDEEKREMLVSRIVPNMEDAALASHTAKPAWTVATTGSVVWLIDRLDSAGLRFLTEPRQHYRVLSWANESKLKLNLFKPTSFLDVLNRDPIATVGTLIHVVSIVIFMFHFPTKSFCRQIRASSLQCRYSPMSFRHWSWRICNCFRIWMSGGLPHFLW